MELARLWSSLLGRRMRAVLLRLELVSAGTTQSYNSSGGGEGESPWPASGDRDPEYLRFAERFEAASDDGQRERLVAAALERLEVLTGRATREQRSRVAGESRGELEDRIRGEGRGYSLAEAAVHFRCPEKWVERARRAGDQRVDNGDPLPGSVDRAAALEEAARLRAANPGMTVRQIAMSVHLPKSTVQDHLGSRAA